jgi:hypothetical protein
MFSAVLLDTIYVFPALLVLSPFIAYLIVNSIFPD